MYQARLQARLLWTAGNDTLLHLLDFILRISKLLEGKFLIKKRSVPLFKTATGQRTFFYRTVSLWNSLETNLKLSESLDIFKRRFRGKLLREFLFS